MSRSDWISVAVALIAIALSYYVGGAKAAAVCAIAGIVILAVMLFSKRGKAESPSQVSQQTASPVIAQTVYVGDQSRPSPSPPQPTPQKKHNIHFVEIRSLSAHYAIGGGELYESPPGDGGLRRPPFVRPEDFLVAIVCFRNDAIVGQDLRRPTLTAHIMYKDESGSELTDAPRGVWLGERGAATAFIAGEKRCLVVFGLTKQNTLSKFWNETYTTSQSWSHGPSLRIRDGEIPETLSSIEVRLLERDTCLVHAVLEVKRRSKNKLPELKLASFSAD